MNKEFRKKIKSGEHSLTSQQVQNLLEAIDDLTAKALFEVAVHLGLRRGDIVKLKWKDVDFESATLSFFESKKDRTRHVPIPPRVLRTLKMLKNSQDNEYYVFPGRSEKKYGKGHISDRTAYNWFQKYLRKAGIQGDYDNKPFHALRATCIKLCQKAGYTPEQAAKLIGDTVRVAQEHYSTPSDEEMREVVEKKELI